MQVNLPQLRVTVEGISLAGAIAFELEQFAYFTAGRFTLSMAMGAPPLAGMAYYAALGLQLITIEMAMSADSYVVIFTGQIDNIQLDLAQNSVLLRGRDLSARFIDSEIAETFANQTSSQIAALLAARHGLSSNITATSIAVGQYYELDHARSGLGSNSRFGTEWNLLVALAQLENFNVSVTSTSLNFGPPEIATPAIISVQNCMEISIEIAASLPSVTVIKSWNTRNKIALSQTAGPQNGVSATLIRPNITNDQAINLANSHLAALSAHGTIATLQLPGEINLAPAMQIYLAGTNSQFDQIYSIDRISREIGSRAGFVETIQAHAVTA